MNYDKPHNETENLSADEQKLREMCRSLKKTDAPPDFDFKLKARLASAKPADFKPRFGFAFRYALPALALILVLGLLAFNGTLFSSGNNSLVAESSVVPQNPAALSPNTPNANFAAEPPQTDAKQPESVAAVANTDAPRTPEKTQPQIAAVQNPKKNLRKEKKDLFIGSRDFSLTEDKTPSSNPSSAVPKPQIVEQTKPMPVKEVLSVIGINADLEDGKWKVRSVRANSVGESSSIKANDVVESIDNQPLSPETVFTKIVRVNSVTVMRNGEKIQVRLRVKQ